MRLPDELLEAARVQAERMVQRTEVVRAAEHVGKGSEAWAVHVHGGEPAYHDSRFTSLMGVTYIADPTPGRHTAGSASE